VRDAARSGGDGVDTYSEPSIEASNKAIGKIIPSKKEGEHNYYESQRLKDRTESYDRFRR
jgi:hypothetical protein